MVNNVFSQDVFTKGKSLGAWAEPGTFLSLPSSEAQFQLLAKDGSIVEDDGCGVRMPSGYFRVENIIHRQVL